MSEDKTLHEFCEANGIDELEAKTIAAFTERRVLEELREEFNKNISRYERRETERSFVLDKTNHYSTMEIVDKISDQRLARLEKKGEKDV